MADGIYIGMAGAEARLESLDAVSDNLSNANSTAYKAERPRFQSFLPTPGETGPAAPVAMESALDLSEGPLVNTGQPLDATPEDGAFLQVSLGDGQVAYTRNGRISIGSDDLLTAAGHPVLDVQGNSIQVPIGEKVDLAPDGTVSVRGAPLAQLATFQLSGPLDRLGSSLLAPGAGGDAEPASNRVRLGTLEGSNFQPIEGMTELITAQRTYDNSMQAIQTYKAMGDRMNTLGTVK